MHISSCPIASSCSFLHLNDFSGGLPSSLPTALNGWLLKPLKSPLPVFRKACLIVSMFSSPPRGAEPPGGGGLPAPRVLRLGDVSRPLPEVETLVGGDVLRPCEDTGDRSGEGDRGMEVKPEVPRMPVAWLESLLSPSWAACSECTTSAKEMKLRRRISDVSKDP